MFVGVAPVDQEWSQEAIEYFSNFVENQYYIFCKQHLSSGVNSVIILVKNDPVNTEMIKRGMAREL